ncbi:GNAT family N-acetyltransferase [Pseudarthrobacter sp. N5]|uniref:GNAT family N-acetyltransferase n=1 Tax=Pseudarthrobacter sp. N5 TaxID=3418416 RepID=UPI003CEA6F96
MELISPILTKRLKLRLLTKHDAAALHRFRGHQTATRYLSHEPLSVEENSVRLSEQLAHAEASTAEWFHLGWAIELRATGEVIGDARAWNSSNPPLPGKIPADHAALGYILHPDHHGSGYGSEAAAALVAWLFGDRGTRTIYAGVYEPNLASRKLLETLGFTRDHHFPADQDSHGKGLPSWRYRLDRPRNMS